MCERGYAILLWHDEDFVGVYTVVHSMEQADAMCKQLLEKYDCSEFNGVSWTPTFIEGE